jgi:PRC-barrel domain
MLRIVSDLQGGEIRATDGEIGGVDRFLFDDDTWTVRYLVVDTGNWLPGRQVLISPIALGETDWDAELLNVPLTRQQIKNSPGIETDKPVSRQRRLNTPTITATHTTGGAEVCGVAQHPRSA